MPDKTALQGGKGKVPTGKPSTVVSDIAPAAAAPPPTAPPPGGAGPAPWTTGDSGQDSGGVRKANFCSRPMKVNGTLYLKGEFTSAVRRIGGWVHLDQLMQKLGKA